MPKELPNRKLNRLKNFDYSSDRFYFVTICVKYGVKFLGEIVDSEMQLNKYGYIVDKQLHWMNKQYPWINLDEYIIMPNHIHGIIKINKNNLVGTGSRVGTTLGLSLRTKQKLYNRQKNLLSKSICAFKTTSSKMIREINDYGFCWQRSFHDRIIRNEQEYWKIKKYIQNNPKMWSKDRNIKGILM